MLAVGMANNQDFSQLTTNKMNENTTKLLEQLAQKLGTTTEYLWRVLLKQAPISATTTLIQIFLILLFAWGLWKIHKRLMKKKDDGKYSENLYEEWEIGAMVPMILGALIFSIMLVISLFSISDVINGYFNPEYWALKEVLNSL